MNSDPLIDYDKKRDVCDKCAKELGLKGRIARLYVNVGRYPKKFQVWRSTCNRCGIVDSSEHRFEDPKQDCQ